MEEEKVAVKVAEVVGLLEEVVVKEVAEAGLLAEEVEDGLQEEVEGGRLVEVEDGQVVVEVAAAGMKVEQLKIGGERYLLISLTCTKF